eukprot:scaffold3015_cov78-Isochrysis_galbana.AAC.2
MSAAWTSSRYPSSLTQLSTSSTSALLARAGAGAAVWPTAGVEADQPGVMAPAGAGWAGGWADGLSAGKAWLGSGMGGGLVGGGVGSPSCPLLPKANASAASGASYSIFRPCMVGTTDVPRGRWTRTLPKLAWGGAETAAPAAASAEILPLEMGSIGRWPPAAAWAEAACRAAPPAIRERVKIAAGECCDGARRSRGRG